MISASSFLLLHSRGFSISLQPLNDLLYSPGSKVAAKTTQTGGFLGSFHPRDSVDT